MATKGRRRRSEEQDDSVIANRVLQDIINNSSDDFRRYLEQMGIGGGAAQGFTPSPSPMPMGLPPAPGMYNANTAPHQPAPLPQAPAGGMDMNQLLQALGMM